MNDKTKDMSAQEAFAMQGRKDPYWPGEHLYGSSMTGTDVAAIEAKRAGQSDPFKQFTTAATSAQIFNEADKRKQANLVQGSPDPQKHDPETNAWFRDGGLTEAMKATAERTPLAKQSLEANQMFKADPAQGTEHVASDSKDSRSSHQVDNDSQHR